MEETGDRRKETGDGRKETGDRRKEPGDRRKELGDGRKEIGGVCIRFFFGLNYNRTLKPLLFQMQVLQDVCFLQSRDLLIIKYSSCILPMILALC